MIKTKDLNIKLLLLNNSNIFDRDNMTTIRHNDKEISFGMWDTFELKDIIKEFNRKHNSNLQLIQVDNKRK